MDDFALRTEAVDALDIPRAKSTFETAQDISSSFPTSRSAKEEYEILRAKPANLRLFVLLSSTTTEPPLLDAQYTLRTTDHHSRALMTLIFRWMPPRQH